VCGWVVTSSKGEDIRKGVGEWLEWKYYVLTYENGKVRPVETIPRMGGWRIKNDGGGVSLTKIHHKCFHNIPHVQQ
jgi:hypothetical protein